VSAREEELERHTWLHGEAPFVWKREDDRLSFLLHFETKKTPVAWIHRTGDHHTGGRRWGAHMIGVEGCWMKNDSLVLLQTAVERTLRERMREDPIWWVSTMEQCT